MDFLILALATFRISSLIADEDGPFGLFEWLRSLVGVKRDETGQPYGENNFAAGVICLWCTSIWIGEILMCMHIISKQKTIRVCRPLALSTVTVIISRWVNG